MCLNAVLDFLGFGGGKDKSPPMPKRQAIAPTLRAVSPQADTPTPTLLKKKSEEEILAQKKKRALEVQRVKRGVKEFGAVAGPTTPTTPPQGITPPTG